MLLLVYCLPSPLIINYKFNRQQDTMHNNPVYGKVSPTSHDPEGTNSPPTLTAGTCNDTRIQYRQQDTMFKNPTSSGPEITRSQAALTMDTSVTPPIYATISENTPTKQSDSAGNE